MDRIAHSIPQTVELTGISRVTLYELIKRQQLQVVKVGRKTLVLDETLRRCLKDLERPVAIDAARTPTSA